MASIENVTELFRLYRDDVYRLAVCYTHNTQEAEDVCQTVFLKLLEQERIDPGKEKAWLMRVTANQCKNLLRSGWWKKTLPMDEQLSVAPPEVNETLQAVMALEPKYRVVFYLHYCEGYAAKEIAELLGISTTAVTTRLSRARQMLKLKLTEV